MTNRLVYQIVRTFIAWDLLRGIDERSVSVRQVVGNFKEIPLLPRRFNSSGIALLHVQRVYIATWRQNGPWKKLAI